MYIPVAGYSNPDAALRCELRFRRTGRVVATAVPIDPSTIDMSIVYCTTQKYFSGLEVLKASNGILDEHNAPPVSGPTWRGPFYLTAPSALPTYKQVELRISRIAVYPVKSLAGTYPNQVRVVETGLDHDREWMIVDREGVFLTQRQHPEMACIPVAVEGNVLRLEIPRVEPVEIPVIESGATSSVRVWNDRCEAVDQGDHAAEILSDFLGRSCRLVRMSIDSRRVLKARGRSVPRPRLGFVDSYPITLISERSLADLNSRLDVPVEMNRFRPNLVVGGGSPFQEDEWQRIRIGSGMYRVVSDCIRCEIPSIDQATGEKQVEPLETLESYRSGPKGPRFGRKLVHESPATIRVGDEVEVLE